MAAQGGGSTVGEGTVAAVTEDPATPAPADDAPIAEATDEPEVDAAPPEVADATPTELGDGAPAERSGADWWGTLVRQISERPGFAVLVTLGIVAGLVLRMWALGRETINSDTAVVGLMAREILHGHFFAFYWGQNYGGPEAYVVAAVFGIFGKSPFTLGLTPLLLAAGSAVVLWRVGNRMFAGPVGVLAALAFWVWPETYVTTSTVEDGFRWLVLLCGMTVMLTTLRIGDGEVTYRDWILLGLATGVGWWASPEIAYFLAPAAVYLVIRLCQRRARVPLLPFLLGVEAALIGALPWIWHNLGQRFNSFSSPPQPPPVGGGSAYWYHFTIFRQDMLPLVLGFRIRGSGSFLGPQHAIHLLSSATIIVLMAWLLYLAIRGRAWLLVLFVAGFPFIYSASPFSWYWQDGRYAVFLAPAAALAVASLAVEIARAIPPVRRFAPAFAAALVLVGGLTLTVDAVRHERPYRPIAGIPLDGEGSWTAWRANPNNLPTELADALVAWKVKDAFAGYWLGYDVGFLSRGRVTVSPAGPAFIRYPPYYDKVAKDPHAAWLFVTNSGQLAAGTEAQTVVLDPGCTVPQEPCLVAQDLIRWCLDHGITYELHTVGPYTVVIPDERVDPSAILRHFHV